MIRQLFVGQIQLCQRNICNVVGLVHHKAAIRLSANSLASKNEVIFLPRRAPFKCRLDLLKELLIAREAGTDHVVHVNAQHCNH